MFELFEKLETPVAVVSRLIAIATACLCVISRARRRPATAVRRRSARRKKSAHRKGLRARAGKGRNGDRREPRLCGNARSGSREGSDASRSASREARAKTRTDVASRGLASMRSREEMVPTRPKTSGDKETTVEIVIC